jgi:tripartite-type tricarboxylate transporter receptor subunit TctC
MALRPFIEKLQEVLGQPISFVYKPGAGGAVGASFVAKSKPDGYTIGLATGPIITNKLQGLMPLDYHDFSLLGSFYTMPVCIFASNRTKQPFKTIEEVLTFAKAHAGQVSLAVAGVGQSPPG